MGKSHATRKMPWMIPSMFVLSLVVFVPCVLFKLHLWIRVLWLQRPSISRVPGPRLAKWTRLWIARALATGRSHEIWTEVNTKYGRLARIGPNHVITDDPETTRRILAVRSGYVRGPWFDALRVDPHCPNMLSERDVKTHAAIRAKVAPCVSQTPPPTAAAADMVPTVHWPLYCGHGARYRPSDSGLAGLAA